MANQIPGSELRDDILDPSLFKERARLIVQSQYSAIIQEAESIPRTVTPGNAKNIVEFLDLVKDALDDYQNRTHIVGREKVIFTYEDPDKPIQFETISIGLERRQPGAFSQGPPLAGKVKNLRPILREEGHDPEEPGYRRAVLGYFHDNVMRITCWALTNKAANSRMLWLEEVMEQYTWYFRISGINRFLYEKHAAPLVRTVGNVRLFGRPVDYFVRTETLRTVKEKELEVIYLRLALRSDENL
jgi:hypothetical protein